MADDNNWLLAIPQMQTALLARQTQNGEEIERQQEAIHAATEARRKAEQDFMAQQIANVAAGNVLQLRQAVALERIAQLLEMLVSQRG